MTDTPILQLNSFGVAFGERVVLAEITLSVPRHGITSLLGPAGSGKSTLLRTLAGLNDSHPSLAIWGEALLDGKRLHTVTHKIGKPGELRPGIGLVTQHVRFFLDSVRENVLSALPNRSQLAPGSQTKIVRSLLEVNGLAELACELDKDVASLPKATQRHLATVRAVASEPLLLMADEPTAGLEDREAEGLLSLLQDQAQKRAVLFVTHNQGFARRAGGTAVLVAGGRVQEIAPAEAFFASPQTELGKSFVRTGGCVFASPDARPEEIDSSVTVPRLPPAAIARSHYEGPRGFFWLWPGKLGGLPRPGIVSSVEHDLAGLRRLGVTRLVTLEETRTVDQQTLLRYGIELLHFPIVDMRVPDTGLTAELCATVANFLRAGQVVALHCRAGLGRTGTMLACQLIWSGDSARDAIEIVRRLNPKCIQSEMQVEFLSAYEHYLQATSPRAARAERAGSWST